MTSFVAQPDTQQVQPIVSWAVNLVAALKLARAGFRVFPARPVWKITGGWNKPPCITDWQSLATANPEQIEDWWRRFPDAIPAICCDEIIVIDADRHAGGNDGVTSLEELILSNGHWPDHPIVATPSGGQHHYFKQTDPPLGNRTGQLPNGIDVRGIGGFVIGPGATLPDGTTWQSIPGIGLAEQWKGMPALPTWMEALIRHEKGERPTCPCRKPNSAGK